MSKRISQQRHRWVEIGQRKWWEEAWRREMRGGAGGAASVSRGLQPPLHSCVQLLLLY
jgi:hypothetical protein